MNTPSTDPAVVAAGLTKDQRRALLALGSDPRDKSVSWSVRYGYHLEALGLAKRTLLTDRTRLTDLGLAVKSHLEGHPEP